ncbi:MAG: hypothetical protein JWN37_898 [Candidatus Nomurabacteria bacterium]|nr:hypothetical protein [Candidatus Nomurabacteria bacterium]
MGSLYKFLHIQQRIYWFIFRPSTVGVKCLIGYNDEYLLIKTAYSGDYWTLPGGGVKKSEDTERSVIREVYEELGIHLKNVRFLGSYTSSVEYKKDEINCFYADVYTKDFTISLAEVKEAKWFRKDNLPVNHSKALIKTLEFLEN